MSSMQHQEVDFSRPQNQDLIWDLDSMARRKLAERFIKLFENRMCVYWVHAEIRGNFTHSRSNCLIPK
tara:strand:- start:15902 stop:16105 length:204 start_codon:yes stop_codon:yes gene_type:complete